MMEIKFERELSAEELADYLVSLASQLRQGEFQVAGVVQKLSDKAAVELSVKEKKGRLTAKIHVRFSTLEHYDQARREAVEYVAEKFKVVKKRLATSFANLKKAAAQGKLPEETLLREFINDNQVFGQHTDPEWQAEMDIYLGHIRNLEQAYGIGNFEMFQHEMADLQASMARCHSEFK
jgi:XXXCH domain-containing protein